MKTSLPSRVRRTAGTRSFRAFLQAQFDARRVRNPKYSLRAFAGYLGLDHSTLSQILRGRRTLTAGAIMRIGERLGLSREVLECYVTAEGEGQRTLSPSELQAMSLTIDAFDALIDRRHAVLLELTRVRSFRPNSRWIAQALGTGVDEVNIMIARLIRLGLLEMSHHGRWEDRSGDVTLNPDELSDVALEQMHREGLELVLASIGRTPPELRDHASITVALSSETLPKVADLVAKFRRDLERLAGRDKERDDVYRVEIAVVPITTLHHNL